MISELIDKQDTFEIVRDKIVDILKTEIANQQILAIAAGKDPADWKLNIYKERSNPWEQWLNEQSDKSPIVNVWFDNANYIAGGSDIVERQQSEGIFNIDTYGFGISSDLVAGGHIPGDREAALQSQKAIRLCRNILMSAEYTYLQLDRKVLLGQRWMQSITVFQPQLDSSAMQQVVGSRLALQVKFNEFSPQIEGEELEFVSVDVHRGLDGDVIVQADYDYTA